MSPIKGLTEQRRLPRVGKIHLGVKQLSKRTGKEYPAATRYFVCPPEVTAVYGPQPTRLDVIIPVEDDDLWCSQYYRQYSSLRGLVCKGDGSTCRRMIDTGTGAIANRNTKTVRWEEGLPCDGRECPDYQRRDCQEVMNLQVLLPRVAGLGIWQIDTGSINSIRNINNAAAMIRAVCDRVSWIPLVLSLEPTEVVNPDDGQKKTVYCLHLKHEAGVYQLLEAAGRPRREYFLAAPVEDEAPLDNRLIAPGTEAHDKSPKEDPAAPACVAPSEKAGIEEETTGPPADEFDRTFGPPAPEATPAPPTPTRPAPATRPYAAPPAQPAQGVDYDRMLDLSSKVGWGTVALAGWCNWSLNVKPPVPKTADHSAIWSALTTEQQGKLLYHLDAMAGAK